MNPTFLTGIFGTVPDPWRAGPGGLDVSQYTGAQGQGLILLFNNLLRLVVVISGIWAFINLIIAGYGFISAEGNSEKVTIAWNRIWQSLLGLLVVASSFALAAIFGYLVFNDPTAILSPKIYGP
jgi:hypothetical protein